MEKILEYRKASAEWMILDLYCKNCGGSKAAYGICKHCGQFPDNKSEEYCNPYDIWHPDIDLSQMGMMEDKLIEEGYEVRYILNPVEKVVAIEKYNSPDYYNGSNNKSKPIAFMKAFMEYIKNNK